MWPLNSDGKNKVQELEEKIEEAEEEKEKWKNRFEAEKERRSNLSREKQEAEEKVNRLKDKIEGLKSEKSREDSKDERTETESLEVSEARRVVEKLASVNSPEKDLVTVYHSGDRSRLGDLSGLKNSITGSQYNKISEPGIYLFDGDQVLDIYLDVRPFFDAEWILDDSFQLDRILDFLSEDKTWVKVSAGDSRIFEESSGDLELLEHVKDRVNRQHRSGGFSQGRFERKREEQIEGHLENLREVLPGEEVLLVGEHGLCNELPGQYLGGFDPNRSDLEALYGFGFRKL